MRQGNEKPPRPGGAAEAAAVRERLCPATGAAHYRHGRLPERRPSGAASEDFALRFGSNARRPALISAVVATLAGAAGPALAVDLETLPDGMARARIGDLNLYHDPKAVADRRRGDAFVVFCRGPECDDPLMTIVAVPEELTSCTPGRGRSTARLSTIPTPGPAGDARGRDRPRRSMSPRSTRAAGTGPAPRSTPAPATRASPTGSSRRASSAAPR